ncbi:MAG: phytoene/squalene synthase family protein [Myxococcota bacterium]
MRDAGRGSARLGSSGAVDLSRRTIAVHSRSFALASRLLPPGVREDAWIVYTWCRRADDAVDESPLADRGAALARLRRELDAVYAEVPCDDPILAAFQDVVARRAIPRHYPQELLEGMAMDVGNVRYESLSDLLAYGYRVAGTVGLMMCHVMGVRRDGALAHAAHLGIAMQLTNVCRDVLEDWHRGRLYLPAAWLAEEGAGWLASTCRGGRLPSDAAAPVARVVEQLLDEADAYYRSGDRGLVDLSWRCALAVRTARAVYSDLGRVLRKRGCDVTAGRAVVSRRRKLWLTAGALLRMVLEAPARLWRWLRERWRPRLPARAARYPADVRIGPSGGE